MRRRLRGVGRLDALRRAPPGGPLSGRLSFAALAACAAALLGALATGGASASSSDRLTVYSAGEAVDGLPLTAVLERDDAAYVSFVYGECRPTDDTGCAPPAEIQTWPACRRSLALYGRHGGGLVPAVERVTVRGGPAARVDGGTRLELQTGDVTVVAFADSGGRIERIAAALRAVDGSVLPGRPFPPPVAGAVEGELEC